MTFPNQINDVFVESSIHGHCKRELLVGPKAAKKIKKKAKQQGSLHGHVRSFTLEVAGGETETEETYSSLHQ